MTYNIPGSESILTGLKRKSEKIGFKLAYSKMGTSRLQPTRVVVVIGEKPYAEGKGDMIETGPVLHSSQVELLKKALSYGVPVTAILINGRPMLLPKEMEQVDTLISYFLPGTMGSAIADLLVGEEAFTGKLPFSWPASKDQVDYDYRAKNIKWAYPLGHGL